MPFVVHVSRAIIASVFINSDQKYGKLLMLDDRTAALSSDAAQGRKRALVKNDVLEVILTWVMSGAMLILEIGLVKSSI